MRTIRAITSARLLGVLVVALATGASAEHHEKGTSDDTGKYFWVETATVRSVDADARIVHVTDALGDIGFVVDASTLIRKGGDTIALTDLDAGDRVAISAHEGVALVDLPVADTITVVRIDQKTGEPTRRGARR